MDLFCRCVVFLLPRDWARVCSSFRGGGRREHAGEHGNHEIFLTLLILDISFVSSNLVSSFLFSGVCVPLVSESSVLPLVVEDFSQFVHAMFIVFHLCLI